MAVIAVDWSGDRLQAHRRIWLAEARQPGRLVCLEAGRDPRAIANHLLALCTAHRSSSIEPLVIGLDFGFSFPSWFLTWQGVANAPALWDRVAEQGETWLAECQPPFWGRPGRRRPTLEQSALRRCEASLPRVGGIAPKSTFQVGGAGAVGTGSIRGMPLLRHLHLAGATIWPYTSGTWPLVVEIYPRLLTGRVAKSQSAARAALLAERYPLLGTIHRQAAIASEDAFDAAVSALVMIEHASDLAHLADLPAETDPIVRLEGRIWHPAWSSDQL